jgi:enamine deaminase RidA (YjgF/YER057c/UK114 family)
MKSCSRRAGRGQIGWNAQCEFETDDLLAQIGQTLANIAAILKEAGARPEHIISMTWYLTDLAEYRAALQRMGPVYRAVMGRHFPPMAVVEVKGLVEARARVEIQATAVLPD